MNCLTEMVSLQEIHAFVFKTLFLYFYKEIVFLVYSECDHQSKLFCKNKKNTFLELWLLLSEIMTQFPYMYL